MNHDEFAFLNQQLAAMLREGLPLEGALKQLCAQMRRGSLRGELQSALQGLAKGVPFEKAAAEAGLPKLYCEMIRLGQAAGDLPGVLTLVADYYRRVGAIWMRLRALLTYPFLVLLMSGMLAVWFAVLFHRVNGELGEALSGSEPIFNLFSWQQLEKPKIDWWLNLWIPPVAVIALAILFALTLAIPALRQRARWSVGPFKDASLAQLAAGLHLVLRQGVPLRQALGFVAEMETGPARAEVLRWMERHAQGHARFADIAEGSKTAPPLFRWIVGSAGENLAEGFGNAAEHYGERARRRGEILLNLVLPCALLTLGLMIMGQVQPFLTSVFDLFTPIFKAQKLIGG